MNLVKDLQKLLNNRYLLLLGVVVAVAAVGYYSSQRGSFSDSMASGREAEEVQQAVQSDSNVQPSAPMGENSGFADINGISSHGGLPPSCSKEAIQDPASLLPKDENSEWAKLNPSGGGNLNNVNLLKAGHHVGIDTVGQSLRNPNLQLRSEPANPQVNIGPWNNTTMQPDLMRVPLEIGQGPQ